MEWQPIETAPKVRQSILVYCEYQKNIYVAYWDDDYHPRGWHHFGGISGFIWECPTHWMPLPAPPAAAKEQP